MGPTSKDPIQVGALTITFLVDAADSGASVTVFECQVPPGARVPGPHSHDGFEETIYGLEGIATFMIDGQAHPIAAGDAVCIPRGAIHGFENGGDHGMTFLAIASPGVFGAAYFRELGDVLAASAGGPPDRDAMVAVMHRHGLTPAQPNIG